MSQAAASPTYEEVIAALGWLSRDNYVAEHNQIILERVPGVSDDLVNSAQFQRWLADEQQVLLCWGGRGTWKNKWLADEQPVFSRLGEPGTEQNIVTSMVVETLFENFGANPNIGIAFVYSGSTQQDRSPEKLLRSMMLQLGLRSPSVRSTLVDFHHRSNNNTSPPSTRDFLDALGNIISKMSKVYLVIDSLDDLSSADRRVLLSGLQRLQNCLPVSLLVTSNTTIDDFNQFDRLSNLDIAAIVNEYDLDAYLHRRFSDLPRTVLAEYSAHLHDMEHYRNKIRERAKGS
jgi:phosphoglycolate phosphatase-like HAD superfamily hydrolase